MQQAAVGQGLSFDPLPFEQDRLPTTEVDVSRGEIAEALVVALVIVVLHTSGARQCESSKGARWRC